MDELTERNKEYLDRTSYKSTDPPKRVTQRNSRERCSKFWDNYEDKTLRSTDKGNNNGII
jgi:hypothetical protein